MLIKEYRIGLPMSVDEYRIAQLYMIQKKSREESHGEGSGVEILTNEPYTDGPGGDGQYTYKIYHIGSHLPGWFRAILPKSALMVEEEAWNAYPYTKTRYRCPFVEKFLLEIETKYINDGGEQENVFDMSTGEIKQRQLDFIDLVKDQLPSSDYKKEEDPKLYRSSKTGRGPLTDSWWEEYSQESRVKGSSKAMMTAYKLCRVEFRYWGMQNKIERFIHDIGLRKTMLRAHRQAWCWQDEWFGLKLSDIRQLELETQLALAAKMAATTNHNEDDELQEENQNEIEININVRPKIPVSVSNQEIGCGKHFNDQVVEEAINPNSNVSHRQSFSNSSRSRSQGTNSRDISASRIFESLERLQESSSESEDEFYDAKDASFCDSQFSSDLGSDSDVDSEEEQESEGAMMVRSSSNELINSNDEFSDAVSTMSFDPNDSPFERRLTKYKMHYHGDRQQEKETSPPHSAGCKSNILFLVLHGGSVLDSSNLEQASKRVDFNMIKSTFETVIRNNYPGALGHIAFRLVPCPQICTEALSILSSVSPYSFESHSPTTGETGVIWTQEFVPLGAISLFVTSNPDYQEYVNKMVAKANLIYHEFMLSDEGKGFTGQVCLLADAMGSLLGYDALCQANPNYTRGLSTFDSHCSLNDPDSSTLRQEPENAQNSGNTNLESLRQLSHSDPDLCLSSAGLSEKQLSKSDIGPAECKLRRQCSANVRPQHTHLSVSDKEDCGRRTSMGSYNDGSLVKFDFDVSDFFMLGSPLGLVLAYRRMFFGDDRNWCPFSPACHQVYNMIHSSDPTAARLEPMLHSSFKHIFPIKVPRYTKFPVGDGEPIHVVETIQSNLSLFINNRRGSTGPSLQRQNSVSSVVSQISGLGESMVCSITNVTSKWWGNKRIDFTLYCPEVLHSFPTSALPHLFHSSFWESSDVAAFVLRQILRHDILNLDMDKDLDRLTVSPESVSLPREKWLKRRTTIKVKNLQPNHRGNDVIVMEDTDQELSARFMYGSFDVTSLSGEKVDVHVMDQSTGEWKFLGTAVTDKHGRLNYTIPEEKRLHQGMHSVKIVVRGDHSCADFFLTVLPQKTETVVFSIDGSFTASMSISGRDPKVRAGAVDVVRHYQDQGYLILYVTARPDMQHRKVVSWLAMHNFPHGMVAFMDGLSKEPLRQKLNHLKGLVSKAGIVYKAAYGSNKDIYVYRELGLTSQQMFIVGKASKKQAGQAQILSDGYAVHLQSLQLLGRSAVGNARMFIRKGCMTVPNQSEGKKSEGKRAVKRVSSNSAPTSGGDFLKPQDVLITVGDTGNTIVQNSQADFRTTARARGSSPRPKVPLSTDVPR
ncbi:protein retinal degeneration B-like [Ylistrum balloti]|uniref:protein retinal degeneration B-like n=1 Tax=Ylistrum balloti TaxID=509963 RepID=UPI002905BD50|nr:protein retinal degeneration B-like [Ylistrum balloti]